MGMFSGLDVSASGLTAQRFRMDVLSANIANQDTTRGRYVNGHWEPYTRKVVNLKTLDSHSFDTHFNQALGNASGGVEVASVSEDPTAFPVKYDPQNPDADAAGYVRQSNVDPLKEMVDLMDANRAYEAGVTVMNANKNILSRALEIGR
ncbi:flagellar basal body rod protein FlgC [Sporolactobacillus inulinus]|jgi:flagellar basal-body rod protein FlgC|uniref:Flagellar basal-body rod protein FlgC n=1 Tax=Sporolactobacillus inulinus CASD TaxID=1069536 RepID=A0A0U1QMJ3_9BACL|nr:flagellar basal body rod protein FlgC [Sporolactobacillus inulinus]KLI01826.1 flagellar basal body rod protein FlgC [Sporolactobacillus inulinus CASD]GEB75892.1 flagellar basal-body rod protein FlgC [Sporolactobacillus inulinus]